MRYDHSDKIGNQGDVVKHAVLVSLVNSILREQRPECFRYTETHCGRPEYILPELEANDTWKNGIKKFADRLSQTESEIPDFVRRYRDLCLRGKVVCGRRYPGSSALVFAILVEQSMPFSFTLFESDAMAVTDLKRWYFPWSKCITVRQQDGLTGLDSIQGASLAFVDPPDLSDRKRLLSSLKTLTRCNTPFLCWTPRNSYPQQKREAETTQSFYQETENWERVRIRWGEWNQQGCRGCQLTVFPEDLGQVAKRTAQAVVDVMKDDGWKVDQ